MGDVVHGDNHAKAFFENPLHSIHGRTHESSDPARSSRKAYAKIPNHKQTASHCKKLRTTIIRQNVL
jgi:hypothetical protein